MRVAVIGEQPVFCEGLSSIAARLENHPDVVVLLGPDALLRAAKEDADLYLVELRDGDMGMQALRRFVSTRKHQIVVFSDKEVPALVREIMELGVQGFIPKSLGVDLILRALRVIELGGRYFPDGMYSARSEALAEMPPATIPPGYGTLTDRQREVLREMGKGRTNRDIAGALKISIATVKLHVNAVLKGLGVRNRTEAALIAQHMPVSDRQD